MVHVYKDTTVKIALSNDHTVSIEGWGTNIIGHTCIHRYNTIRIGIFILITFKQNSFVKEQGNAAAKANV